jgi:hypothetical protein
VHDILYRSFRVLVPAICVLPLAGSALHAQQQPAQPPAPSQALPALASYRAPVIALVQPQDGGTVYQDRPVVVLRFGAGEPTDPLDLGSFAVTVDGVDRTKLFQTSATEAWGPIAQGGAGEAALATGPHRLNARICSTRGACTVVQATVYVLPLATTGATSPPPTATRSLRQRILDAALNATRRILIP